MKNNNCLKNLKAPLKTCLRANHIKRTFVSKVFFFKNNPLCGKGTHLGRHRALRPYWEILFRVHWCANRSHAANSACALWKHLYKNRNCTKNISLKIVNFTALHSFTHNSVIFCPTNLNWCFSLAQENSLNHRTFYLFITFPNQ